MWAKHTQKWRNQKWTKQCKVTQKTKKKQKSKTDFNILTTRNKHTQYCNSTFQRFGPHSGIPSVHKTRYLPNAFLVLYGFLNKTTSTTTTTTEQQSPPPNFNNFDKEVTRIGGCEENTITGAKKPKKFIKLHLSVERGECSGKQIMKKITRKVAKRSKHALRILEQKWRKSETIKAMRLSCNNIQANAKNMKRELL